MDSVNGKSQVVSFLREWWMWLLGVPLGLTILVLGTGAVQSDDQQRAQAQRAYAQCAAEIKAAQDAQLPVAAGFATFCDSIRTDFVQKYGTAP